MTLTENWTPTAENVNALPEHLRRYIHDLETLCDPAGIVAENTMLKDQTRQLWGKILEQQALLDDIKAQAEE